MALFCVLVAITMLFLDEPIARAVRAFAQASPGAYSFFRFLTDFGSSAWILIGTGIGGIVLSSIIWSSEGFGRIRRNFSYFADANFMFFTVAVSGIVINLTKNTIGRARPHLMEELGPHWFEFAAFTSRYASFPSGHSTTFGALCMGLALLFPKYRAAFFAFAVLGGFSRMMLSAHYLSDVMAGLACGMGFSFLAARYLARRNLMFRFGDGWLPERRR